MTLGSKKKIDAYHHGDLRDALLACATKVVAERGAEALSLRACARAIGVDIAATYRHFKNKEALLGAIAARGFAALSARMGETLARVPESAPPDEHVLAVGTAYIGYGLENPQIYRLMFGGLCSHESIESSAAWRELEHDPYAVLCAALDRMEAAGSLRPGAREGADLMAWTMVHGVVSLVIDGRIGEPVPPLEVLNRMCCDTLMRGIGAG